ncbi:MAG: hypothetical protein A9957_04195 [Methanohalophilus sp. DAL1]|nr:MAG: hypothetical protein A9957_04195 [Methanohalophilus sp. DAL1]
MVNLKMRKKNLILVTLVLLVLMFSFGCTESITSNPENTLKKYVIYYNGIQGDDIYDLFSNDLKKEYSKDQIHNIVYATDYSISDYEIIEKTVTDKVTTLNVDITWDMEGIHITNNYNIEFVFEDDEWKINSNVIRYHP